MINQCTLALKRSNHTASKLLQVTSIIEHTSVLADFESIGFRFKPSARGLLAKYRRLEDNLEVQQIAEAIEELKQRHVIRESEECVLEAKTLLWKIGELKRTLPDRANIRKLETRLQTFLKAGPNGSPNLKRTLGFAPDQHHVAPRRAEPRRDVPHVDVWMDILANYGLDESNFHGQREALKVATGYKPTNAEVIRALLNRLIWSQACQQVRDLKLLQMLYYSLALLADDVGQPSLHLLVESNRLLLMRYKKRTKATKVQILTVRNARCAACEEFDGVTMSLTKALETMPIPCAQCPFHLTADGNYPFTCTYLAIFKKPLTHVQKKS